MRQFLLTLAVFLLPPLLVAQQAPQVSATGQDPGVAQQASEPARPPVPHTLLDGTPVKLRLTQTMSSADAKVGQDVPFEVVEEVDVDGVPVIQKGATAIGNVTAAEPKKRMGRGGKLDISISYVRLTDQEKAALRAIKDTKGGGHVGAMTGAMVATGIVFFPAAPLFLFMHGKDITIPQGTEITAFVQGDMHLDMARFAVGAPAGAPATGALVPAATAVSSVSCSLAIQSTPPGADIQIDGAFVGNTPSTVNVTPGAHEVTLKRTGFADWTRKLNVTGGNITLDATLDPATN